VHGGKLGKEDEEEEEEEDNSVASKISCVVSAFHVGWITPMATPRRRVLQGCCRCFVCTPRFSN
jgi:hypothetical protein